VQPQLAVQHGQGLASARESSIAGHGGRFYRLGSYPRILCVRRIWRCSSCG
jgi:hypothetical protein